MDHLAPGALLQQYRIVKVLGSGGFSVVYQAEDLMLDKLFAIKEYFPDGFAQRDGASVRANTSSADNFVWGKERFIEEARTLARFNHPSIVKVIQIFEANNTAYMVLEYLPGRDFKQWLAEIDGPPNQLELDKVVGPLLDALGVIHSNHLLHRDVAPDNIYICDNGTPVLLDFGSAKEAIGQRTRTVSAVVKDGYSPAEQYSTKGSRQGPWTDIYAFAATLYHAVTGARPDESTERLLDDDLVPARKKARATYRPAFLEAIDWGLRLAPRDRPKSVADWRRMLLVGDDTIAHRVGTTLARGERSPSANQDVADEKNRKLKPKNSDKAETSSVPARAVPGSAPTNEKPAPLWRFAVLLAALAVLSALLSAYASQDPWNVLHIRFRTGNFSPPNPPILPAAYFGLVLCTGFYLWRTKSPTRLAAVFTSVMVGWIAAHEFAVWITSFAVPYPLVGFAAGGIGGSFVGIGVYLTLEGIKSPRSILLTSIVGAVAGLPFLLDERGLLLFLAWQPSVAASVAYVICRPTPSKSRFHPRLITAHQAMAITLTWLLLGVTGIYFKQYAELATEEETLYTQGSGEGFLQGPRNVEKLQAYLDTCKLCEKKAKAMEVLEDEKTFALIGNDIGALRAYIAACGSACAHGDEARARLAGLE